MTSLLVSEVFGPTAQGEGPTAGRRCCFVRLGRCNLTCGAGDATWCCDTPYTWDWKGLVGVRYDPVKELTRMTVMEVIEEVRRLDRHCRRVVISGGEPLLQRAGVVALCDALTRGYDMTVEIETNGTRTPPSPLAEMDVHFNVSPKLANSGVPEPKRIVPPALAELVRLGASFKFVAVDAADLAEIAVLVREHQLRDVWVMPAGTTAETVTQRLSDLADAVIAYGWNLTSRLHVLCWGEERGR